jgi:hypothetical protein
MVVMVFPFNGETTYQNTPLPAFRGALDVVTAVLMGQGDGTPPKVANHKLDVQDQV